MFNYKVKTLLNNEFVDINLYEHIRKKTVLICPGTKFIQKPTLAYFEYIDSLLDSHRLDEILIVSNKEDAFFPMLVRSYFPRFTTIIDNKKNYISEMKDIKKVSVQDVDLAKEWIFQQLCHDGVEKGFWQQPLSDHWQHITQDKKAMTSILKRGTRLAKILQKLYKEQHKRNIWNIEHMNYLFLNTDGSALFHDIGPSFFYWKLFKNNELESTLGEKH
jgi:hypothetical protein